MFKKFLHFLSSHKLLISICLILGAIPFFWFKPGYIDIGGDSSRLYFYDPTNFLKYFAFNLFLPDSLGIRSNQTYIIPFVLFLMILRFIFQSPWIVNNVFNAINLIAPFLSIYAITTDFIQTLLGKSGNKHITQWGAIIAGLFYVFIPMSSMGGWDLALSIQAERFVYPLIFLLLLRFILSSRMFFLLLALLTSFVFAQNFSWVALPNMISFFLLSVVYLTLYAIYIKKLTLPIKKIVLGFVLFPLLHAFQYLPLIINIFQKNSDVSNQLLQGSVIADTFHYVDAVASYTERGYQFIGVTPFSPLTPLNTLLVIFPLLIIIMLIKNRNIKVLLPTMFLLVLYWLVTAKITKFGLVLFKEMFYIPGFVMFRDFFGRFLELFLLLYAVLVGYASAVMLGSIKKFKSNILILIIIFILIINALPLIFGQNVNRILTQDTGVVVKSHFNPDKNLENVLSYFRSNGNVGRNLSFPIADFDYQLLAGENNDGSYFGPSMIAYLTGKADLASNFTLRPFALGFFESIKNNDFQTAANIFPLLGIRTLFYNSNPYTYEAFATFPYNDVKLYFPKTQKGLSNIISKLPLENRRDFGSYYHIYEVSKQIQLPIIYTADKVLPIGNSSQTLSNYDENTFKNATYVLENFRKNAADNDLREVFLSKNIKISSLTQPKLSFLQITPSKYIVSLTNVRGPYLLVFSQSFNTNWKLYKTDTNEMQKETSAKIFITYFNHNIEEKKAEEKIFDTHIFETLNKNSVGDANHYVANAYANAWYIKPSDGKGETNETFILEMSDAKFVYLGFIISGLTFVLLCGLLMKELILIFKEKYAKK